MKNLSFVIFAAMVSMPAIAAKRPNSLVCAVRGNAALEAKLPAFILSKLDTARPASSIPDTGLSDLTEEKGVLSLFFSNECDNGYMLKFSTSELEALSEGYEHQRINATLSGGDSDTGEVEAQVSCIRL